MKCFLFCIVLLFFFGVSLLLLFVLIVVFVGSVQNFWDSLQLDCEQVIVSFNVVELFKWYYYNKLLLNDECLVKIYDSYLKMFDLVWMYFIVGDIVEFDCWCNRFDDFFKSGDFDFGFVIYKCYFDCLKGWFDYVLVMFDKGVDKIDFSVDESLLIDCEKVFWVKDIVEFDDFWCKKVKDEVLCLKIIGKDDKVIQEQFIKCYKNQLLCLKQICSEDIFQVYINVFVQFYDLYIQYLLLDNVENFDINMSFLLEGIGVVLQSDNDYVKVVCLVLVGLVVKSKQIVIFDKIIGVVQGKGEMVDVVGWCLDEVVKLICGLKGFQVCLEVILVSNVLNDQISKIVVIICEVVKLEDQVVKKFIIKVDYEGCSYKFGVIDLLVFYLDFKVYCVGDLNYKSIICDVKKLVVELQKDKVDGIVFDLCNNGGGFLQEVIELIGLFIDQGLIVLVCNSDGCVDVFNDDEGKVFYIGLLVVLVNCFLVFVLEIFVGVMQDYYCVLIFGGQIFGKGIVQIIQLFNYGELKLILVKFY